MRFRQNFQIAPLQNVALATQLSLVLNVAKVTFEAIVRMRALLERIK